MLLAQLLKSTQPSLLAFIGKTVKDACLTELAEFQANLTTNVNKDIPLGELVHRLEVFPAFKSSVTLLTVMQQWLVKLMQRSYAVIWQAKYLKQRCLRACGKVSAGLCA